MAQKRIIQSFESFGGVDLTRSALSANQNTFQSLLNMEPAKGAAIRGRRGCQIANGFGNFIGIHGLAYSNPSTGAISEELLAMNDNLFKQVSSSFTITRVAGALDFSWAITPPNGTTQTTFRFVLTQGGAPVTLVHPVTGASAAYLDLKTGLEDWLAVPFVGGSAAFPVTILDLIQAIDGTANFSVTYPDNTARCNGAGAAGTFTVDAGHSISVGDVISVFDTNLTTGIKLVPVKVTATTATTVVYDNSRNIQTVDNQTIGQASAPAASIRVDSSGSTTNGSPLTVPYQYWQGILTTISPYKNYTFPFTSYFASHGTLTSRDINFRPPNFINANSSSYIFTEAPSQNLSQWEGYPYKYDRQNIYRAGLPEYDAKPTASLSGGGGLSAGTYYYRLVYRYYDNNGILTEGVSKLSDPIVATAGQQAGVLVNYVQSNAQTSNPIITANVVGSNTIPIASANLTLKEGDFIYVLDRITSDLVNRQVTSIVRFSATEMNVTFSGSPINANLNDLVYINPDFGYNFNAAIVNGDQIDVGNTSGTLITVYNNAVFSGLFRGYNTFKVGDTVYFFDFLTSTYQTRVLSVVTPTTIGWDDGARVEVHADNVISCNMRVAIYRTKVGGTTTYLVAEVPNSPYADAITYFDTLTDAQLGAEFIEPVTGKEPNPPPRAGIGCSHQGKLVYGRIADQPNTIAWSDDVGGLEAVPLASNYADVPATVGGPLTALGSDNDDHLAVFKENAFYDISGDLENGLITILGVKEGDYGISAQTSLRKVSGVLVGVGKLGIVAVSRGQMISDKGSVGGSLNVSGSQITFAQLGEMISPALINNNNLLYSQAVAVNDFSRRIYNFYVPSIEYLSKTGSSLSAQTFNSPISYAWDYGHLFGWFDRAYDGFGIEPTGGFAMYVGEGYFLSSCVGNNTSIFTGGGVFRYLPDTLAATISAADNHYAVRKSIVTYPLTPNTVSFDSQFQQFKLFRFLGTFESRDLNACTIRLRSYRNYQTSTVDSTRIFSFTANAENIELFNSLNSTKARGMLFIIDAGYDAAISMQQIPYISGYEIITDVDYGREDYHE